MALNTAALDTRIKATIVSTMYDMTRVNANGYFDSEDSEEKRFERKTALNNLRTEEYKNGEYSRAGGCLPLPVPEDVPFFVKDYSEYYKGRAYHEEIRSAVLMIHGDKAHSCYFAKDAYKAMTEDSKYTDNKELMIIPGAVHTDLYDNLDVIPFDKIEDFIRDNIN